MVTPRPCAPVGRRARHTAGRGSTELRSTVCAPPPDERGRLLTLAFQRLDPTRARHFASEFLRVGWRLAATVPTTGLSSVKLNLSNGRVVHSSCAIKRRKHVHVVQEREQLFPPTLLAFHLLQCVVNCEAEQRRNWGSPRSPPSFCCTS